MTTSVKLRLRLTERQLMYIYIFLDNFFHKNHPFLKESFYEIWFYKVYKISGHKLASTPSKHKGQYTFLVNC